MAKRRKFDQTKHKRNKFGRLVSAKASEARREVAKKNPAFQMWRVALQEASKMTGIKITPQHLHKGSPLHTAARQIYELAKQMDDAEEGVTI